VLFNRKIFSFTFRQSVTSLKVTLKKTSKHINATSFISKAKEAIARAFAIPEFATVVA